MTTFPSPDLQSSRRALLIGAGHLALAGLVGGLAGCASQEPVRRSGETPVPPPTGGVLFDAALTSRRDLGAYPYKINTDRSPVTGHIRARLLDDPVHGSARTVVRMESDRTSRHDAKPSIRVQCETSNVIRSARHQNLTDIYYVGFALYLPKEFRILQTTDWLSFAAGAYGPPYGGSGPLSLGLRSSDAVSGEHRLVLANRPELLGNVIVPRGRWIDLVMGFRMAYAQEGGWLSIWMNEGDGWKRLPVSGKDRPSYDALSHGVNDGWHMDENQSPNTSRIGVYGNQPNTLLHGWHRIAQTFRDAMPNSYPETPLPKGA